jgi:hypothetical protein
MVDKKLPVCELCNKRLGYDMASIGSHRFCSVDCRERYIQAHTSFAAKIINICNPFYYSHNISYSLLQITIFTMLVISPLFCGVIILPDLILVATAIFGAIVIGEALYLSLTKFDLEQIIGELNKTNLFIVKIFTLLIGGITVPILAGYKILSSDPELLNMVLIGAGILIITVLFFAVNIVIKQNQIKSEGSK